MSTNRFNGNRFPRGTRFLIGLGIFFIVVIAIFSFMGQFFYFWETVEEQEVGVQFEQGQIKDVVGSGVYSDFGLFVSIQRVSSQAIPFVISDEEMITKDKQRIGLVVSGDIFRPDASQKETLQSSWARYKGIYLDDALATTRVQDLARQSMKVCVGDRTFDDNIIGTSRDALRTCIDDELNELASVMGLRVENLVIPEVILSPEVQTALDAIVQSRLLTEKAAQDQLKAQAEAGAEQARQEGEIRIEQSRIQEQTKQQTILADLEQQRLASQLAVIEASRTNELALLETERVLLESQKQNDLIEVQLELEISLVEIEVAEAQAEAALAEKRVLAVLYQDNPEYLRLLLAETNASALTRTDKIIFTTEGTTPTIVVPGPGIVPTVNTTP